MYMIHNVEEMQLLSERELNVGVAVRFDVGVGMKGC